MWLFKKKQVEKFNISEESYDSLFIDIFDNVGTIIDTVSTFLALVSIFNSNLTHLIYFKILF